MQSIFKNNKGFTAIEMIIVAGIMALLLAVSVANFRNFERSAALSSEAENISSIIREAEVWALTGKLEGGQRYAWGVHFETCEPDLSCGYSLFRVDESGDKFFSAGQLVEAGEETLLSSVYISGLNDGTSSLSSLDIVFVPPMTEDDIYFNNTQIGDLATITLQGVVTGNQKTITVNRISGQIEIN